VAFEVALVRGGGRPWDDVIAQYALWKGSLWPLLVLWVLAAPAALSALQRSGIAAHRPGARGEPAGLAVGALGRVRCASGPSSWPGTVGPQHDVFT
jgi:hypothetical protein